MKSFGKIPDLLVVFAAIIVLPSISAQIADALYPIISNIDPDKVFGYASIHHIAQFVLTIILMKLWSRNPLSSWGFNLNEYKESLRITGVFCLIFIIIIFGIQVVPYLISGKPPTFNYEINARNVTGFLTFAFLLPGTCEEPLFRGFAMILLSQSWKKVFKLGKLEIPSSGLWATLLFMLAHIGFSFETMSITHFSLFQQFGAFCAGIYYAILFHRTKSLLGPILSHGFSDGIFFGTLYVMYFALG